jgi:Cu/Ag efflux pump CusA
VLAAQFESFVSAAIVMATVPLGLACAVFALLTTGTSLNVYSQIGLVLLVGVMAKNGILIVEFANQLRDEGASVREAIERGTLLRLRPVMMTMVSTVLGGVPLIFAAGPGAEAREALGWVIVGGLGLATLATLYLTPRGLSAAGGAVDAAGRGGAAAGAGAGGGRGFVTGARRSVEEGADAVLDHVGGDGARVAQQDRAVAPRRRRSRGTP